jgi:hypothetical protein
MDVLLESRERRKIQTIKQYIADARNGGVYFSNEHCVHTYVPRAHGQGLLAQGDLDRYSHTSILQRSTITTANSS